MKFDCLITNPPYQDSSHKEKKNTLWRKWLKFNEILVNEGGVFSLIIPSSWLGSNPILKEFFIENNKLKYNISYINRDECKRHFKGIGSTFSYFIQNKSKYLGNTTIISKNIDNSTGISKGINLNDFIIEVFPRDLTELGASILSKTLNNNCETLGVINNTYNHSVHRKKWRLEPDEEFCYPIQNTPSKVYWYNYAHPHQGLLKLLIPTTTYFRRQLISDYGTTQSFCYVLLGDNSPEIVLNNVNNKLFDYLNECFRYANWNSVNLLRKLPKIPFDRNLNDNEIYEYFNLTKDEINHINKLILWR
jgi:hypothetical protein